MRSFGQLHVVDWIQVVTLHEQRTGGFGASIYKLFRASSQPMKHQSAAEAEAQVEFAPCHQEDAFSKASDSKGPRAELRIGHFLRIV